MIQLGIQKVRKENNSVARKLGFASGQVVQESGYPHESLDPQLIDDLRDDIEAEIEGELVYEDYGDLCDGVLLWWCAADGDAEDLTYALVDAKSLLDDNGQILLVVPARGHAESVDHTDISDAAKDAALSVTNTLALGDCTGVRLISRGR